MRICNNVNEFSRFKTGYLSKHHDQGGILRNVPRICRKHILRTLIKNCTKLTVGKDVKRIPANLFKYSNGILDHVKEMIADEGNDECTMGYSVVRYYNVLISTLDQIRNKIVALPIVDSTDIVSAIENRISHLTSEINNVRFISSVQYYEGQDPHSFYDMGDLYRLSQANGDVVSAFKQQLDKTVTSRYHTTQFYSAYGSGNHYHDITYYTGISTSSMVEHYSIDWVKTSWYEATH